MKPIRILAFADYYLPGYKGGGPAVSISRLVKSLQSEAEFWVFTRDRDLGDAEPYASVPQGEWTEAEGGRIFYAPPEDLGLNGVLRAVQDARPDAIYLNSCFSKLTRGALQLRLLGFTKGIPIVIAPRGEFSPGALRLKSLKKRLYLAAAKLLGLHRRVVWQVSSEKELADAKRVIGPQARCIVKAPDLLDLDLASPLPEPPAKAPGSARFVLLSRISPMKNIHAAIEMLAGIEGEAELTIYGPAEDSAYLEQCRAASERLPKNVSCRFAGPVPPHEVRGALAGHHFFLLPTLGENFGHVIAEALGAGCPVLISDRTPWTDLEAHGAGWVIPLERPELWKSRVQACVDMGPAGFDAHRRAARAFIESFAASHAESGLRVFEAALELGRGAPSSAIPLSRKEA